MDKFHQKRPAKGGISKRQRWFCEYRCIKGKFYYLFFSLQFPLSLNYIILYKFINLLDVTLSIYLYILYIFEVFPWHGSNNSRYFGYVSLTMTFGECKGSFNYLTVHLGRLYQGRRRQHMNQWATYYFRTPLKVIWHTNNLY